MINENPRYKRHSIYSNRSLDGKFLEIESTPEKVQRKEMGVFLVRGKPDFSDLNFTSYNWERINKPSLKQKEFMENTQGYKDYKETIIYKGPQGRAIVHANYRKDQHKINIYIDNPDESHLKMNAVKFMFQSEWGYQLKEINSENLALIEDIESN